MEMVSLQRSLLCFLFLIGSTKPDDVTISVDQSFPLADLIKMQKPGSENSDSGESKDEDDNDNVEKSEDEYDDESEEGSDNEDDSDDDVYGDEESDDDDDDDDEDDDEDDEDDDDDDDDEDDDDDQSYQRLKAHRGVKCPGALRHEAHERRGIQECECHSPLA
ncbi:phosphopantothenoylcysteine decarboxylase subunit SIS2-like [Hibiscus syriacus]|uniref:phosphopantothenoylcysteine decarboxylase subunit SIS2-like n=1 Tax=Hibiscus syriacus TaxID=106335 RepID=UPI001920A3BA|nr:phosphopantothenoylcysteine decarboxylase subunit SIS2-like [Hibiscus syriacus]